MQSEHTVVVGAGPAGLAAAYTLAKAGKPVTVLEGSPHAGGLCRTIEMFGQRVDLGPHRFFSTDPVVNALWSEVVGEDYAIVERLTRIVYRNRLYEYPLRPLNVLKNLGVTDTARALFSYARAYFDKRPQPHTFDAWVTKRFGRRLYEAFFKTYTEKVWGVPCSRIDADWAAQRIKKFSLKDAIADAILPRMLNPHATPVDCFAYPDGGAGALYERMVDRICHWGGKVHFRSPVTGFSIGSDQRIEAVRVRDGRTYPCSNVISSMPLSLLVESLPRMSDEAKKAASQLTFRNTVLAYLEIDSPSLFDDQWLYIHADDLRVGRITNFRNWSPSLHGVANSTILCLEYWCYDQDELWRSSDDQIVDLAMEELRRLKLHRGAKILNGASVKLRRSYPVYRAGYVEHVAAIQKSLAAVPNLSAIGRYGSFKYNNQDHSLLMGIMAAENVLDGINHDLWAVNCDSTYQEATRLSKLRAFNSSDRRRGRRAA